MPRNDTLDVAPGSWVEITSADVTSITFVNNSTEPVFFLATVGAVEPTSLSGAIRCLPGFGARNEALTDLWPGVTGANRVWAYAPQKSEVMVSHA